VLSPALPIHETYPCIPKPKASTPALTSRTIAPDTASTTELHN